MDVPFNFKDEVEEYDPLYDDHMKNNDDGDLIKITTAVKRESDEEDKIYGAHKRKKYEAKK